MKLCVDSREPNGLIELLKLRVKNIEFGNLDIGDFIIKNDNGQVLMIFERKQFDDLIASIKDGRYNEQSFRLNQFPLNNHNIFYVIEGKISDFIYKNNEQTRKMLFSSMLSLSYTKGFSLLTTTGWLDTAECIIRFMDKLQIIERSLTVLKGDNSCKNNTTESSPSENSIEEYNISQDSIEEYSTLHNNTEELTQMKNTPQYTDVIKVTKKSNVTKANIGEIMLAQIPGVSMHVAQSLMVEYKTIKDLIKALENNSKCLDNFKVESKSGKRNISKTVIKNVKDYLVY